MDMIAAFRDLGSLRAAAEVCGTTHKTVKRALARDARRAGGVTVEPLPRAHNYDGVADLVGGRVAATRAKISAKRLLPEARAEGYTGSARNFRRLVATAKAEWKRGEHARSWARRPAVWSPGEHLVIDWGVVDGLHVFCAVSAWSRWRFVRLAADEKAVTTLALLAECFEAMGGVPRVVLADRMGCLKGGVVANVVVPTPTYVRFASHYRFRPDFCQAADPESKGIVENLVGYAKRDLMIPNGLSVDDLVAANADAVAWCAEVNAQVHSEICAVPEDRRVEEVDALGSLPSLRAMIGRAEIRKVDKLSVVRFGSARYSVPDRLIGRSVAVRASDGRVQALVDDEIVADHPVMPPGEASILDEHYSRPRPTTPVRAVRARTQTERDFLDLGPVAENFLKGAAAAGVTKLGTELADIVQLCAAHGPTVIVAALERAVAFGRWRADDIRSIVAAGTAAPRPTAPGDALLIPLPLVPARPLAAYSLENLT